MSFFGGFPFGGFGGGGHQEDSGNFQLIKDDEQSGEIDNTKFYEIFKCDKNATQDKLK